MDGHIRAEITNITGTVTIAKIEMPLVGTTRMGVKPGRETRDGSFSVQKVDSHWEKYVYEYLSQNLAQRRANRGKAAGAQRPFVVQVWLDDPDALGVEVWQLSGCLVWNLPLGFNITDDVIDQTFNFGWETERPLETFEINHPITPNPVNGLPSTTLLDTVNPGKIT
jgi:hypothetical protein